MEYCSAAAAADRSRNARAAFWGRCTPNVCDHRTGSFRAEGLRIVHIHNLFSTTFTTKTITTFQPNTLEMCLRLTAIGGRSRAALEFHWH